MSKPKILRKRKGANKFRFPELPPRRNCGTSVCHERLYKHVSFDDKLISVQCEGCGPAVHGVTRLVNPTEDSRAVFDTTCVEISGIAAKTIEKPSVRGIGRLRFQKEIGFDRGAADCMVVPKTIIGER